MLALYIKREGMVSIHEPAASLSPPCVSFELIGSPRFEERGRQKGPNAIRASLHVCASSF